MRLRLTTGIRALFAVSLYTAIFASLWIAHTPTTHAAGNVSLYLSPGRGGFYVGSTFNVSIVLNTRDTSINTIEAELSFPQNKIQIASPSVGNSIIQIWATNPSFSNRDGKIYFVGGIPSPGIKTSDGIVLTMTFRVIAPGSGTISFGPQTRVLANDGSGTNVLGQSSPATFTFSSTPPEGPVISSPTHPDQEQFYKNPSPLFTWVDEGNADGYSYSFDEDPNGIPDTTVDTTNSQVSFENKTDGVWYFHLRARKNGVWGGISTYSIRIDTTSPAVFTVNVSPGERTTNTRPIIRFFTTDSLSGFDHFEMKLIPLTIGSSPESSLFYEIDSPYQFTELTHGRYTVIVRAFDKAGNWRDAEAKLFILNYLYQFITSEGVDLVYIFIPWKNLFSVLLLLLLLLAIILLYVWWLHRKHKREMRARMEQHPSQPKPTARALPTYTPPMGSSKNPAPTNSLIYPVKTVTAPPEKIMQKSISEHVIRKEAPSILAEQDTPEELSSSTDKPLKPVYTPHYSTATPPIDGSTPPKEPSSYAHESNATFSDLRSALMKKRADGQSGHPYNGQ